MLAHTPASAGQGFHHHRPRSFNFPNFYITCGLEEYGLVDRNQLERDLSASLLRTLAVGMKQQSESVEAALDME